MPVVRAPVTDRRVGIDVGGTNTDAVLIEDGRVMASIKTPTTEDVTGGIVDALAKLSGAAPDVLRTDAVMIGTTHFTNAVVRRRELVPVAALRIGLPASASLPPFVDWPAELRDVVRGDVCMVRGGHEYDGTPLVPLDQEAIRRFAERLRDDGLEAVAVCSIFSPLTDACEAAAAAIVRETAPDVAVSVSHELGRIGLLERENATLLNATLTPLAARTVRAFEEAVAEAGILAPLFLTQNDGTVMSAEVGARLPVLSFASGPTNSMRGAAYLTGIEDAMVVDVGGTTTDVGHLRAGFPRQANAAVEVGGVRTTFRMPDLLSLGLGGGSVVDRAAGTVGPDSVGYRLTELALAFGGSTPTATDVAVAAGLTDLGSGAVALAAGESKALLARMHAMVTEGVDRMKADASPLPLVAVGGAAFLVPADMEGISEVVHVERADVANAVGAAIAQVSGEVDRIFQGRSRDDAIAEAAREAERRAVASGAARRTLQTVEVDDIPVSYLPGDARRVRVRVVGDVAPAGPAAPPS
jgi:N-methylhydantoinase A/oxoprolinase/acetone carboxylase beta subunit